MPENAFRQYFLAEFTDDGGDVFQNIHNCMNGGTEDPQGRMVLGIDLAKYQDYSVCIGLDQNGDQFYHNRWNKCSWEMTITRIKAIADRFPNAHLWVDQTGVGDPIWERLKRAMPNRVHGVKYTNEIKEEMVETLQLRFEQEKINLYDLEIIKHELEIFEYKISLTTKYVTYNAPIGFHDDVVNAIMLAVYGLRKYIPVIKGKVLGKRRIMASDDWMYQ